MAISIQRLIDDAKCFEMVRELRWPEGVCCPHCDSKQIVKNGHDTTEVFRQRYRCGPCKRPAKDNSTDFGGSDRSGDEGLHGGRDALMYPQHPMLGMLELQI